MESKMLFFDESFHPMYIVDKESFNIVKANKKAMKIQPIDMKKNNYLHKLITDIDISVKEYINSEYTLEDMYVFNSWYNIYFKEITLNSKPCLLVQMVDISPYKKREEKAEYMAYHDAVTNLPNRRFINYYLNHTLKKAMDNKEKIGLMFIDLDNFKNINDVYGHIAGDEVLKKVSKYIKNALRKHDIISRFGGDEFLVVLENMPNEEIPTLVAQRILQELKKPVIIEEKEISISCSIGIGNFPEHGSNMEELVSYADNAMYEAKKLGKNTYV